MSKSEYTLSYKTTSFEICVYIKLTYFFITISLYFQKRIIESKHKCFRPVEEKGLWSNFYELLDISCFGILRGSILRIDLVIRLKGGRNQIKGPKLNPKVPKFPKIYISRTASRRMLVDPSK